MNKETEAIFPGTFNPFHHGHFHILKRGLKDFKKIYIVISINPDKPKVSLEETKINTINFLKSKKVNNYEVIINNGLTTDICNELNITNIIRGYRNKTDLYYEKKLMSIYQEQNPLIKVHIYKSKICFRYKKNKKVFI